MDEAKLELARLVITGFIVPFLGLLFLEFRKWVDARVVVEKARFENAIATRSEIEREAIRALVITQVRAAEQFFKSDNMQKLGEEKLLWVIDNLKKILIKFGLPFDEVFIRAVIEEIIQQKQHQPAPVGTPQTAIIRAYTEV